jgi:hypothetical protein
MISSEFSSLRFRVVVVLVCTVSMSTVGAMVKRITMQSKHYAAIEPVYTSRMNVTAILVRSSNCGNGPIPIIDDAHIFGASSNDEHGLRPRPDQYRPSQPRTEEVALHPGKALGGTA